MPAVCSGTPTPVVWGGKTITAPLYGFKHYVYFESITHEGTPFNVVVQLQRISSVWQIVIDISFVGGGGSGWSFIRAIQIFNDPNGTYLFSGNRGSCSTGSTPDGPAIVSP
jgi:hypothetical protein